MFIGDMDRFFYYNRCHSFTLSLKTCYLKSQMKTNGDLFEFLVEIDIFLH